MTSQSCYQSLTVEFFYILELSTVFLHIITFPDSSQKFRTILYSTELHVRFYVATSHFTPLTMVTLETAGGPIQSPSPPPPPHKPPEPSQQHFAPVIQAIPLQHRSAGTRNNPGTQTYVDRHGPNADHTLSPAAVTMATSDHPPIPPTPLITLSTRDRRRIVRNHRDPFRSQPLRRSSIRQQDGNTTHMPHITTATTTTHTSPQQYTKKKKNDPILSPSSTTACKSTAPHSTMASTLAAPTDKPPIRQTSLTHRRIVRNTALSRNHQQDPSSKPHPRLPRLPPAHQDETIPPTDDQPSDQPCDTNNNPVPVNKFNQITTTTTPDTSSKASNSSYEHDPTIDHNNKTQPETQRHPTTSATLDPATMKAIRASHVIQQQIADIQDTLQNMLAVLHRNSLPPPSTKIPSQDPPIREIRATDQPQPILLFDLSGKTAIDTLALQLKHQPPQYQDYMTLLLTSRDRCNRFSSPPLHAVPRNHRNLPDI